MIVECISALIGGYAAVGNAKKNDGDVDSTEPKKPRRFSLRSLVPLVDLSELSRALTLYVMTEHRSLVVTTFVLPLSFLWDTARCARARVVRLLRPVKVVHETKVADIVAQVRRRPTGAPMCTARPGWMSISLSSRSYKENPKWAPIQMNLMDILHIDEEAGIVHVEPSVTIGELTRALLPRGYTLPVVPEMDDLTVGGLINGTGIESSSHRYGLFHEICVEFEMCLGDGRVVVARAEGEHEDLFRAVPWSYGTLGLLLSKLRILPSEKYVKVTYTPHTSRDSLIRHFTELSEAREKGPMFVESLAYSKETGVVMSGEFVPESEVVWSQRNHIGLWFKPWFFKHVEGFLQKPEETVVEYIPTRDYYHRHSQSLFWEMELMIPVGNHPLFRWVLGWLMPPKVSFLKLSQTEFTRELTERTHVAQDYLVPIDRMGPLLDVCDKECQEVYPLWLCPHDHGPMGGSLLKDPIRPDKNGRQMYLDIGVYGLPKAVRERREDEFDMRRSMRAVFEEVKKEGGFQMLYGDVFNTREEFEEMFGHKEYRELRKKYKADDAFKEVYDKMHVVG